MPGPGSGLGFFFNYLTYGKFNPDGIFGISEQSAAIWGISEAIITSLFIIFLIGISIYHKAKRRS